MKHISSVSIYLMTNGAGKQTCDPGTRLPHIHIQGTHDVCFLWIPVTHSSTKFVKTMSQICSNPTVNFGTLSFHDMIIMIKDVERCRENMDLRFYSIVSSKLPRHRWRRKKWYICPFYLLPEELESSRGIIKTFFYM